MLCAIYTLDTAVRGYSRVEFMAQQVQFSHVREMSHVIVCLPGRVIPMYRINSEWLGCTCTCALYFVSSTVVYYVGCDV